MIKKIMIFAALLTCITIKAYADTPEAIVSTTQSNIAVSGKASPGALVTIVVAKDCESSSEIDESNIVYFDTFSAGGDGSYSKKFKSAYDENCSIFVKQGETDITENISAMTANMIYGAKVYTDISENKAYIEADNILGNASSFDAILAAYDKSGSLTNVKAVKNNEIGFNEHNKVIEISDMQLENTYELKAFIVESINNIKPLSKKDSVFPQEEIKSVADKLFADFVPESDSEAEIYNLYKNGEYSASLKLFRDITIDTLKKANLGSISNKYLSYNASTGVSELLLGEITNEEYIKRFPSEANKTDFPPESLCGNSFSAIDYDWVQSWADSLDKNENLTNMNLLPSSEVYSYALTGMYSITGEKKYIDKMLAIQAHWFKNGYAQAQKFKSEHTRTPEKDRGIYFNKAIQGYGTQAGQCINLIRCISAVSKNNPSDVNEVLFAQIIGEMLHTQLPYLYECVTEPQDSPNIKQSVTETVSRIINIFDEFKVCEDMLDAVNASLENNLDEYWYSDGGYLEEHLNYSDTAYNNLTDDKKFYASLGITTAYTNKLSQKIKMYQEFRKGITTPSGLLPQIGNNPNRAYPAVWQSEQIATAYGKTIDQSELAYKSVYFPMSGISVMRSGRNLFDTYACMYTGSRRAKGHKSANTNSLWMYAKGRLLVTSGDTPWYDLSFCPEKWKKEYNSINRYFAENSTYKNSTVIVNGVSQSETNNGQRVQSADNTPIPDMKWSSSEKYDFSEGLWNGGYTSGDKASHKRELIYVKNGDFFITTDNMLNSDDDVCRQIWCFPERYTQVQLNGFDSSDVSVDETKSMVYTNEENAPNIYIMQFGSASPKYYKYSGTKNIDLNNYLGWGGLTYNKTVGRIPKCDVHIEWKTSESPQLISVLMPAEGRNTPYTSKSDISDEKKGINGFSITKDGNEYKYMTSQKVQDYKADGITFRCKTLLYNETDKSGIVLGAESSDNTDFEFEINNGTITVKEKIKTPENFEWKDGAPIYE